MRIVPDGAVNGTNGSTGLVGGLPGIMLRGQAGVHQQPKREREDGVEASRPGM